MAAFYQYFPHTSFNTFDNIHDYQDTKKTIALLNKFGPFDCVLSNNDDLAAGLKMYFATQSNPPLIISQEAKLSGQLNDIPSIDNHTYQVGIAAFEAAKGNQVVTRPSNSTFHLHRS